MLFLIGSCFGAEEARADYSTISTNSYAERIEVQRFISQLSAGTNQLSATNLNRLFSQIHPNLQVLQSMTAATIPKPWFQYRTNFVNPQRIANSVAFMRTNKVVLARAQQVYSVPPEVITAILCLETDCGRVPLKYKAMESLCTLGFDYPPRTNYFRRELEQFLILCREVGWDPLQIASSRDGGLGLPQFMPTSYRRLAIDFDGDHKRDLINNPNDSIGSIANYLKLDKWMPTNAPMAIQAKAKGTNYQSFLRQQFPIRKNEDWLTVAKWRELGVKPKVAVDSSCLATLVELQGEKQPELWMVFWDFNVITTYNHNPMYAMAVDQLSQAIRRAAKPGLFQAK